MSWHHPELGEVRSMFRRTQPYHVWKHLYDPVEAWGPLSPLDPGALFAEARRAGAPPFGPVPTFDRRLELLLERHHDRAYQPAYGTELADPAARWAPKLANAKRWMVFGPRGVIIVIQLGRPAHVVTAYRPHPMVVDVDWADEDFVHQAERLFEKETGMPPPAVERLASELRARTRTGVATTRDAWWLALAVARGRGTGGADPRLLSALHTAEELLAGATEARALLAERVATDAMLDRLAAELRDDDTTGLEGTLSDLEDALLVLEVIQAEERASELLDSASELLAWIPYGPLGHQATLRREVLPPGSAASTLWLRVEEAVVGAVVRESIPATRPSAVLVDRLVPVPSVLERVASIAGRGHEILRSWVTDLVGAIVVAAPSPAMGHRPDPWVVSVAVAPSATPVRAFVVDADYPDGHEVLLSGPTVLWHLEKPGQVAHVVIVAGHGLDGTELADLLEEAAARDDVVVATRRVSRPR